MQHSYLYNFDKLWDSLLRWHFSRSVLVVSLKNRKSLKQISSHFKYKYISDFHTIWKCKYYNNKLLHLLVLNAQGFSKSKKLGQYWWELGKTSGSNRSTEKRGILYIGYSSLHKESFSLPQLEIKSNKEKKRNLFPFP